MSESRLTKNFIATEINPIVATYFDLKDYLSAFISQARTVTHIETLLQPYLIPRQPSFANDLVPILKKLSAEDGAILTRFISHHETIVRMLSDTKQLNLDHAEVLFEKVVEGLQLLGDLLEKFNVDLILVTPRGQKIMAIQKIRDPKFYEIII
ncbi:MAG: hypothetical protein J0G29_01715 [Alphaproteobacteria bacterium]|nr:hypothetical protein [Alphaproteobacteria bacterium]OJV45456.1 MAG: hypothetical protein BGO28_05005 [Alphaproteobacteria bacterium 43-37]